MWQLLRPTFFTLPFSLPIGVPDVSITYHFNATAMYFPSQLGSKVYIWLIHCKVKRNVHIMVYIRAMWYTHLLFWHSVGLLCYLSYQNRVGIWITSSLSEMSKLVVTLESSYFDVLSVHWLCPFLVLIRTPYFGRHQGNIKLCFQLLLKSWNPCK